MQIYQHLGYIFVFLLILTRIYMLTLDSKNKIKELDLTLSEFYQLLPKFVVSFWEQKFSKEKRTEPKPTISDPEIITLALNGQQLESIERKLKPRIVFYMSNLT